MRSGDHPQGERPLRLQLWSYNYAPEPTGIAPVSTEWAKAMSRLGHEVEVVAAFPHYPEPVWDHPRRPYREERDGIPVLRLPLWVGRANAAQRIRQELTFAAAQMAAIPALHKPDVMVAVSPSFPALLPAIANSRLRGVPWVLWLHDVLPDGAAATGLIDEGSPVIKAARRLERAAYRDADRIVVLSQAFVRNLEKKGVPSEKIELIYDPATRIPQADHRAKANGSLRLLSMGNIGFSQGLAEVVRSFEAEPELNPDVTFAITGNGVAADDVAEEVRTPRVEMLGLVPSDRLEQELQQATVGLVSQKHGGEEFNIPSKLMNFMQYGLPILAVVDPRSEVARIVRDSGAGWIADNASPESFAHTLREVTAQHDELKKRGQKAAGYARSHFDISAFAQRFDAALRATAAGSGGNP